MTDDLKRRLEREAELAPKAYPDVDSVLRGGKKRRRTRVATTIGTGLVTVLAVAVGAWALDGPTPRPDQPPVQSPEPSPSEEQSCAGGPRVRPSRPSGEVGDHIDLSGKCLKGHGLQDVYLRATVLSGPRSAAPRNRPTCDLVAEASGEADVQDGTLQGFFIVPEYGACLGEEAYKRAVPVRPGTYDIAIGCKQCVAGTFRVQPPPVPATMDLATLPAEGFIVQNGKDALFVGSDGQVHERLSHFELFSSPDSSYVLFKGPGNSFYELDETGETLEQLDEATFGEKSGSHLVPSIPLPEPAGARVKGVGLLGMWTYHLDRKDGVSIAQWSDKCGPVAFWVAPDQEPQIITGESSLRDPHVGSTALGWSSSGEAYVYLGDGACGGRGNPPGIYAFSAPGEGRLVYEIVTHGVVMWP